MWGFVQDFACWAPSYVVGPRVIVVLGSSMDSGKSHTARSIIKGLRAEGHTVAGIKVTGTATGSDTWGMLDAGARPALDFIDGGYPSTYLLGEQQLVELHEKLLANAVEAGAKWVVIEVADGILQQETAALIRSARFTGTVDAWVFATGDPLGAVGGISILEDLGIQPLAVSGVVSRSALARREVEKATGLPCLTPAEIEGVRFIALLSERVGA